jgi:fatty acid desaturase
MALMNHNSEKTLDVARRNSADDWGIAQICSCADWAVQTKFLPSIVYLWLNYHCVHHLFPLTDFSHHRDIQAILMETCLDHNVEYEAGDFFDIYRQMVNGFGNPRSLWMEINVYNGS